MKRVLIGSLAARKSERLTRDLLRHAVENARTRLAGRDLDRSQSAWPAYVSRSRRRVATRSRVKALTLAAAKLPIKTRFIERIAG